VPATGYTLALSWSPEFCRGKERDPAQRLQCSGPREGGIGRFGFVVHGLWPEGARQSPQWCRRVPSPSPAVVRAQLCRTPAPQLIGHEWAKHGSCMARSAASYFTISNALSDAMRYPAMERLSRDPSLTAGALRQALAEANPGRPASSFGLLISRNGWLREVRLCLDRRFRASRCPAPRYGPRDSSGIKIWRGL
jgi:ribonuclease T2